MWLRASNESIGDGLLSDSLRNCRYLRQNFVHDRSGLVFQLFAMARPEIQRVGLVLAERGSDLSVSRRISLRPFVLSHKWHGKAHRIQSRGVVRIHTTPRYKLFHPLTAPLPRTPYPVPQSRLYSNRRTSSKAFSPPKAKEFESATRTAFSRAWLGT